MVMRLPKIRIEPILEHEHIRKARVIFANKTISTPCYMSKIRSSDELNIICDNPSSFKNIQGVFFDIYNVKEVIKQKELHMRQKTIFGTISDEDYLYLKNKWGIFIDPCTEYLYFNSPYREKYLKISDLPVSIKNMLQNSNPKNHFSFWKNIMEGEGNILSIINWYIKYQASNNADIIMPPVPLIDGNNSKLLDYAININRYTSLLAEGFHKPTAIYFPINFKAFRNTGEELKNIWELLIEDDEEMNNIKLILIKIVNYNFNSDAMAREALNDFFLKLGFVSRNTDRGVFLLDADSLGLVALFNNIDGFIEPLNANIKGQRGAPSALSYMGRYYHPEKLEFVPFERLIRLYESNGQVLPCDCPACGELNGTNLREMNKNKWNEYRRRHLLYRRDQEIKEANDAIINNQIRGISDKIYRSSYKNYIDLIPNSF